MTRRKPSLADLCGGRFAFMPAAACEHPDLPHGPFRLYAIMCARAKLDGTCKIGLKYIAKKRGVSARTIQKWKRELELQGWLQQLHQGDKEIGTFRVIRDPSERKHVRLSNVIKVGIRSAAKTPHANKSAHPRCEESDALINKKGNRNLIGAAAVPTAERSSPTQGLDHARQGNPVAAGPGSSPLPFKKLNQKIPPKGPDWQSCIRWLAATRPMNKEKATLWIMGEIDRLKKENDISSEEAGWMLHRQLRREKELDE